MLIMFVEEDALLAHWVDLKPETLGLGFNTFKPKILTRNSPTCLYSQVYRQEQREDMQKLDE